MAATPAACPTPAHGEKENECEHRGLEVASRDEWETLMTLSSEAVSSRLSDWSYCRDAMEAPWPERAKKEQTKGG
jgi:hypothetical protein